VTRSVLAVPIFAHDEDDEANADGAGSATVVAGPGGDGSDDGGAPRAPLRRVIGVIDVRNRAPLSRGSQKLALPGPDELGDKEDLAIVTALAAFASVCLCTRAPATMPGDTSGGAGGPQRFHAKGQHGGAGQQHGHQLSASGSSSVAAAAAASGGGGGDPHGLHSDEEDSGPDTAAIAEAAQAAMQRYRTAEDLLKVATLVIDQSTLAGIAGRASELGAELVQADRCSFFFVDEIAGEFFTRTRAPHGGPEVEHRYPATRGISSSLLRGATHVNVADAYLDPRFDASNDEAQRYRTRSVLCVPVHGRRGELVAVIQFTNKLLDPGLPLTAEDDFANLDPDGFTDGDIAKVRALAVFCGMTVTHATVLGSVKQRLRGEHVWQLLVFFIYYYLYLLGLQITTLTRFCKKKKKKNKKKKKKKKKKKRPHKTCLTSP
jgi:hypothetical protein